MNEELTRQLDELLERLGEVIEATDPGTPEREQAVRNYRALYDQRVAQYRMESEVYTDARYKEDSIAVERKKLQWAKKDTIIKVSVVAGITVATIVAENAGGYVHKALDSLKRIL